MGCAVRERREKKGEELYDYEDDAAVDQVADGADTVAMRTWSASTTRSRTGKRGGRPYCIFGAVFTAHGRERYTRKKEGLISSTCTYGDSLPAAYCCEGRR